MKSIQLYSRETGQKALIILLCLGFPALVGYLLPTPLLTEDVPRIQLIDAGIAVALGVFVWGVFCLIEPRRHGRRWLIAKLVGIPIIWLILVLILAVWFHRLHESYFEFYETFRF